MLTEKQKIIFDFIRDYQLENGGSPTLREMREYLKVNSDNSVLKHLNALVSKGYIEKGDTPRSIALLPEIKARLNNSSNSVSIPVLGTIPAGGPIISEESVVDRCNIDVSMIRNASNTFMLKVTGDSMINAGIFEDDLVLVDNSIEPRLGDIVVALVDNGNTVKRYMKDKSGRIFLRPENDKYSDIYPEREMSIQGVVTALMRTYF